MNERNLVNVTVKLTSETTGIVTKFQRWFETTEEANKWVKNKVQIWKKYRMKVEWDMYTLIKYHPDPEIEVEEYGKKDELLRYYNEGMKISLEHWDEMKRKMMYTNNEEEEAKCKANQKIAVAAYEIYKKLWEERYAALRKK